VIKKGAYAGKIDWQVPLGTRKRDFAEVQKLGEKPLDKANWICDNTAILRKQTKNL
jgi:hypothetical protein